MKRPAGWLLEHIHEPERVCVCVWSGRLTNEKRGGMKRWTERDIGEERGGRTGGEMEEV